MQRLIILRGNSGSGKSTIAKKLRSKLGSGTMLISQDFVRRDILGVKDDNGNPTVQLLSDLVHYGKKIDFDIILEGILNSRSNGNMLLRLIDEFTEHAYVYYFDIPFEETLRRHKTKPNKDEFGEAEMRRWWIEKDYLGTRNEKIISEHIPEDDIVAMISQDIT